MLNDGGGPREALRNLNVVQREFRILLAVTGRMPFLLTEEAFPLVELDFLLLTVNTYMPFFETVKAR